MNVSAPDPLSSAPLRAAPKVASAHPPLMPVSADPGTLLQTTDQTGIASEARDLSFTPSYQAALQAQAAINTLQPAAAGDGNPTSQTAIDSTSVSPSQVSNSLETYAYPSESPASSPSDPASSPLFQALAGFQGSAAVPIAQFPEISGGLESSNALTVAATNASAAAGTYANGPTPEQPSLVTGPSGASSAEEQAMLAGAEAVGLAATYSPAALVSVQGTLLGSVLDLQA